MSIYQAVSGNSSSQYATDTRLHIEYLLNPDASEASEGSDVVKGLTQTPKTLPPRYFYDDRGSQLFEQICELPEYYPTRTEAAILHEYAGEIALLTNACEIVELGSGSSTKTRILLDAYEKVEYPLRYLPIDVSGGILESSARQLLADYPSLQVHGLVSTYELALQRLQPALQSQPRSQMSLRSRSVRAAHAERSEAKQSQPRTICFLGSTLGNLNPQECDVFLSQITAAMEAGDYFLLGVDLQKSKEILEAAYNDSQGVTAAFNINMLHHLNQRFEGNFDTTQFEHWAFYNESQHQIEMHLRSRQSQTVHLRALNLTIEFAPGETILTEISRKFDIDTMKQELQTRGLVPLQVWTDSNQWFGLLLCQLQS